MTILSIMLAFLLFKENKKKLILSKQLQQIKKNPDQTLNVLNDLMSQNKVVLEVRRVDSSEIFLRSPKGL